MSFTRRWFCRVGLALPTLLAAASSASGARSPARARVMLVRHGTLLVEIAGRRVLVDPCFAPGFGVPGVLDGPPPALRPEEVGPVDLLLLTSGDPGSLDAPSLRRLDLARARALVPDERSRARVARGGARAVRVVQAGDVVTVGPLRVTVSPGRGALGPGAGFHLDDGETRVWLTGPLPPIDVDAVAAAFAADHPADVVIAWCSAMALRAGGPPLFADIDDVDALARRARARVLIPVARDARPTGVFDLVLRRPASPTVARAAPRPDGAPHVEIAVPGTWIRFAPGP